MQPVIEDAVGLAVERDIAVSLLYVVDERTSLTLADEHVDEVYEELRSQGEAVPIGVAETMVEYGVDAATKLHRGNPAEGILVFAEEIDAALISMGTYVRFEDNILGSVSRSVVVQSKIPVLTTPIERQ